MDVPPMKTCSFCTSVLALFCLTPGLQAQAWRDAANTRIDTHRKSDLSVRVVNGAGVPVPGADVEVKMKRHSFRFGTAVTASLINNNSSTGNTYRAKLLENFNEVVFENDMKWPAWSGLWGNSFNWPNTQSALNWLDANNLPARGHYLSWGTWSGQDAYNNSQNTNTLPSRLFNHISDIGGTVGDRVYEWDVINHPIGWLNDTYENRVGEDFYGDIVDHARTAVPEGVKLYINEDDVIAGNSRAEGYERVIRKLNDDGSPVDGIGFQAHFIEEWSRVSNSTPEQVYDRIDRFSGLAPALRVTEFDIDVGNDEQLQGQLMRDYLTMMFSHEEIEAVTMWGFWGGAHWRGQNGALYRNNWTEKPSLTSYRDLVFGEWWTEENGQSDAQGAYDVRAFDGFYDIVVNLDGEEYVLSDYQLSEDATVDIVVDALPGDFNDDGKVDAADYTVYRDNLAGTFTPADYLVWSTNFGATATAVAIAVPEPISFVNTAISIGLFLAFAPSGGQHTP